MVDQNMSATQTAPLSRWDRFKQGWKDFWGKVGSGIKQGAKATGELLYGSPAGYEQVPLFEPHQQNFLNFLLENSAQGIQNPSAGFDPIENEVRRNFYEKTIPGITEQFQGGRLSSPVFASQLASAGRGLESILGAQKAQYGLQNRAQLLNQAQLALTPQFQTQAFGATPGAQQNIANTGTRALVNLATGNLGLQ